MLSWRCHQPLHRLQADTFDVQVLPAWRPDKATNIEKPDFAEYIGKLASVSGVEVKDFASLKEAIKNRLAYFAENGCCVSDHGIEYVMYHQQRSSCATPESRSDHLWYRSGLRWTVWWYFLQSWNHPVILRCTGSKPLQQYLHLSIRHIREHYSSMVRRRSL